MKGILSFLKKEGGVSSKEDVTPADEHKKTSKLVMFKETFRGMTVPEAIKEGAATGSSRALGQARSWLTEPGKTLPRIGGVLVGVLVVGSAVISDPLRMIPLLALVAVSVLGYYALLEDQSPESAQHSPEESGPPTELPSAPPSGGGQTHPPEDPPGDEFWEMHTPDPSRGKNSATSTEPQEPVPPQEKTAGERGGPAVDQRWTSGGPAVDQPWTSRGPAENRPTNRVNFDKSDVIGGPQDKTDSYQNGGPQDKQDRTYTFETGVIGGPQDKEGADLAGNGVSAQGGSSAQDILRVSWSVTPETPPPMRDRITEAYAQIQGQLQSLSERQVAEMWGVPKTSLRRRLREFEETAQEGEPPAVRSVLLPLPGGVSKAPREVLPVNTVRDACDKDDLVRRALERINMILVEGSTQSSDEITVDVREGVIEGVLSDPYVSFSGFYLPDLSVVITEISSFQSNETL